MNTINCNYKSFHFPNYRAASPAKTTNNYSSVANTSSSTDSTKKIDWKTIGIIAGVALLTLVGITKRKSIANFFEKFSEPHGENNLRLKPPKITRIKKKDMEFTFKPEILNGWLLNRTPKPQPKELPMIYFDENCKRIVKTRPIKNGL